MLPRLGLRGRRDLPLERRPQGLPREPPPHRPLPR